MEQSCPTCSTVTLLALGSPVRIGERGEIEGIVTSINLRPGRTTYEISYWHMGEHRAVWLETFEVQPVGKGTLTIGFLRGGMNGKA